MRKGLTPVIAMVLLLMMAVAAAGLMYTFAFNLQTKAQTGVERTTTQLLEKQQEQAQTRLSIDSVYNDGGNIAVVIRNVGSKTITDGTTIGLYIDGVKYDVGADTCDNLDPEDTCTVTTTAAFPGAGSKSVIRVVAPSGISTTYTCYSDGTRC